MARISAGKVLVGSPRFLINKETLAGLEGMQPDVLDRFRTWARGQEGVQRERLAGQQPGPVRSADGIGEDRVRLADIDPFDIGTRRHDGAHAAVGQAHDAAHHAPVEGRLLAGAEERVRHMQLEMSQVQARHNDQLTQLADTSQARMRSLEAVLREKKDAIGRLDSQNKELERMVASMNETLAQKDERLLHWESMNRGMEERVRRLEQRGHQIDGASEELLRLQSEIQTSSDDLERKASRLMDLMRLFEEDTKLDLQALERQREEAVRRSA